MIVGVGLDVADVGRVADQLARHGEDALAAVLTPAELAACRARGAAAYAARFAAKEACAKALGTGVFGRLSWQDMEVHEAPGGRVSLRLTGRAGQLAAERGVRAVRVSLTRTADTAAAVVVLEA